jgi:hypothetical protein
MKIKFILSLLVTLGLSPLTAMAAGNAHASAACKARVETLIKKTAVAMGMKTEFGLQLTERPGKNHLLDLVSGAFIVADGYISDSSAVVSVHPAGNNCRIVKISIQVGPAD